MRGVYLIKINFQEISAIFLEVCPLAYTWSAPETKGQRKSWTIFFIYIILDAIYPKGWKESTELSN